MMQKLWPPLQQLADSTKMEYAWYPDAAGRQQAGSSSSSSNGSGAKYVAPPRRATAVVLVGGATRMPIVREYVTRLTGLTPR